MSLVYKIVEVVDGMPRCLFHGIDGSRKLKWNKWYKAKIKAVRDGSGDVWYISGWHSLMSEANAKEYIKRFRRRNEILKIVLCEVKGAKWIKPTKGKHPVVLSEYIQLKEIIK